MSRLTRRYGGSPLHLLGHLALFAVAAFALDQIFSGGDVEQLLAWYIGFALLHDLVLVPAYTAGDRIARAGLARIPRQVPRAIPLINHVRVPAVISGVLLLVYAPLITGAGAHTYFFYSGHHVEGYLRNWLLITLGLFAGSAITYAVRVRARRRR
jgi:hypothetical protein